MEKSCLVDPKYCNNFFVGGKILKWEMLFLVGDVKINEN
jgi:hypothetical protein